MKIPLTEEQIAMIIKAETERLQNQFETEKTKLEKKLESDLQKLTRKYELEISKLQGKYKYVTIEEPNTKKRTVIDREVLKQMVADKKSVAEIAAYFNSTENSIRNKLSVMKLRLSDNV